MSKQYLFRGYMYMPVFVINNYMIVPEGMTGRNEHGELMVCKWNKFLYVLSERSVASVDGGIWVLIPIPACTL